MASNEDRARFAPVWTNSIAHWFQEKGGGQLTPNAVGSVEEWKPFSPGQIINILRAEAAKLTEETGRRHEVVGRRVIPVGPDPLEPLSTTARGASEPGDGSRWNDIGII